MAKARILVVEDERIVAEDVKRSLRNLGYMVSAVVTSGSEAIEQSEKLRPDLVLMDVVIKGKLNGIKTAEQIRSRFDIPVIYLTAYADEGTLERAKVTEPFGYILKPFDERDLQSTIEMGLYKHEMERKLRESEVWFSTTLRSIGDGVIVTDKEGCITFMNGVAENLTGWEQKEALGKPLIRVFDILSHVTGGKAENSVTKVLHEGVIVSLAHETDLVYKGNGRKIPITANFAPIKDDREEIVGAVLVFHDISERMQAEVEKERIQAQLLQSQKMEAVGILAGGVAHDFNNLLTVIQGNTDLAMMKVNEADSVYTELSDIQLAATRAASLTNQLLLFSRKQPMKFVSVNLNRTVVDLLKMLHRLIGEDIVVNTEFETDLWAVQADRGTIEQVIMNLSVNARDAMPGGGRLSIKTENVVLDEIQCNGMPEAQTGRFVCLSISDTGIGMDEETVQHVFEPFFSTKGPGKGTGLGLSVVYGIIQQHDGWIHVISEFGSGSTFKIYLPAVSEVSEGELKEEISLEELMGQGERILLVEDEEDLRGISERVLKKNGYIVFSAANAWEAMDIFEREHNHFHLIFSDVVLPGKTGIELADEILCRNSNIRVLLSSGYAGQKSRWSLIQERGYRFLQKPYTLHDLLQNVREVLVSG